MTDDIRKYRALVESALSSVAETASSTDLDSSARDAAELMVHIFRDSKDADLHNVIRSALKGYHKDTAGQHDYKDWGRAVIKHVDRLHRTIHE